MIMKKSLSIIVLALTLLSAGCPLTINVLLDKEDKAFLDDRLKGKWKDKHNEVMILQFDSSSYYIEFNGTPPIQTRTVGEENDSLDKYQFRAYLTMYKNETYLNLQFLTDESTDDYKQDKKFCIESDTLTLDSLHKHYYQRYAICKYRFISDDSLVVYDMRWPYTGDLHFKNSNELKEYLD